MSYLQNYIFILFIELDKFILVPSPLTAASNSPFFRSGQVLKPDRFQTLCESRRDEIIVAF
jgi:hypothetical protein